MKKHINHYKYNFNVSLYINNTVYSKILAQLKKM